MGSKWRWKVLQWSRLLWVRASLFAVAGGAIALSAWGVQGLFSLPGLEDVGASAVERLLEILASSMLAVTTFSLSVMVGAFGSATSNASPRATRLLMQDSTTQNVLATFLGSFLFSIVGIIALNTEVYNTTGRALLFLSTLGVLALIVFTLLRWIEHLTRLGRVGETLRAVERSAADALRERALDAHMGAKPRGTELASEVLGACAVCPPRVGYVQFVDVAAINAWAEQQGCEVWIEANAGTFVHPTRPLAHVMGLPECGVGDGEAKARRAEGLRTLAEAFTIGDDRSFDQDPRFGLIVLGEAASRALSPAVNDPGTAIDVIGRQVRLLRDFAATRASKEARARADAEARLPRVRIPMVRVGDMFDDAFTGIARDGAGLVEVQVRLLKGLRALLDADDTELREHARRHAALALARAEHALTLPDDLSRVRDLARSFVASDLHAQTSTN